MGSAWCAPSLTAGGVHNGLGLGFSGTRGKLLRQPGRSMPVQGSAQGQDINRRRRDLDESLHSPDSFRPPCPFLIIRI